MAHGREEQDPGSCPAHFAVSRLDFDESVNMLIPPSIASMVIGIANKVLATTIYGSPTFIAISCAWVSCIAWDVKSLRLTW